MYNLNEIEEKINKALLLPKTKTMKSISMLDFPGLGLKVENFKEEFNTWPMQLNFAIRKQIEDKSNWGKIAIQEFHVNEDKWINYLNGNGSTPNNTGILDFTEDLDKNLDFFLNSQVSTFRLPNSLKANDSWDELAIEIFDNYKWINADMDYDLKLVLDCSFQEHRKWSNLFEQSKIGCKHFRPILTSNSICYSFNGQNTSSIWKNSRISRLFGHIFEENSKIFNNFNFRGTGPTEGELKIGFYQAIKEVVQINIL